MMGLCFSDFRIPPAVSSSSMLREWPRNDALYIWVQASGDPPAFDETIHSRGIPGMNGEPLGAGRRG